jgi:hypothetical protein
MDGKADFIAEIDRKALQWRSQQQMRWVDKSSLFIISPLPAPHPQIHIFKPKFLEIRKILKKSVKK